MQRLRKPISIKSLKLKNRAILAPLAGVSDIPFRRICQEHGAALTFVEMLSAKAINYKNQKTFEMMARHKSESLLGVQLTGANQGDIESAVSTLNSMDFDIIDINMGCPVKKVTKSGCGSALLLDLKKMSHILERARASTNKPLSAKIRIGYSHDIKNVEESSGLITKHGLDMLTIHGRLRSDNYSVPCKHAEIRKGLKTSRNLSQDIVCIGNGDIFRYEDAAKMIENTDCDGVMVSRGALGNPWLFKELISGNTYNPRLYEWYDTVLNHIAYQKEYYGDTELAAILMRKHLLWYAKGFPGSKTLKTKLCHIKSIESAQAIIHSFYESLPKNLERFSDRKMSAGLASEDPKYEMDRKLDRGVGSACLD